MAAAFGLARKWDDRFDTAKAEEKYNQVIALDPEGKAGSFTDPDNLKLTAPYADFARYELAAANSQARRRDPAPLRQFIDAYPASPLVRQAYDRMNAYYLSSAPKEEAAKYFAEFAARYPADPEPLVLWLRRIIRDKGPVDKGFETAAKLREMTRTTPTPSLNLTLARFYDMAGDKAAAEAAYGKTFMDGRVESLAHNLIAYANYWSEKKENRESAAAMVDTAAKIGPDNVFFVRDVADAYMRLGEEAKAMNAYGPPWLEREGARLSDQDINSYAAFWVRQGKNLDSALAAAKKAVELQPKAYYYWSVLSDVYVTMGNTAEAVKAVEKAVQLAEGNAKVAMQKKLDGLKGAPPKKK